MNAHPIVTLYSVMSDGPHAYAQLQSTFSDVDRLFSDPGPARSLYVLEMKARYGRRERVVVFIFERRRRTRVFMRKSRQPRFLKEKLYRFRKLADDGDWRSGVVAVIDEIVDALGYLPDLPGHRVEFEFEPGKIVHGHAMHRHEDGFFSLRPGT